MLPIIRIIVPTYGVFTAIGFITAFVLLIYRSRALKLGFNKILQLVISAVFGVVIGSRSVFILTMIPEIIADFNWHTVLRVIINGGFVFYGGLLGAIFGIYLYCRYVKLDTRIVFNTVTPIFPLFHCFGRIGCFFAGCCYGIPSKFGIPMAAEPNIPRFPVQLAEALCCIIIFAVL